MDLWKNAKEKALKKANNNLTNHHLNLGLNNFVKTTD